MNNLHKKSFYNIVSLLMIHCDVFQQYIKRRRGKKYMKPFFFHEENRHEKKWLKLKPVINVLSSVALVSSILIRLTNPVESHAQLPIQKKMISAGKYTSLVIGVDGNVYGWGNNNFGELGDGTTDKKLTPVKTNAPNNVVSIESGSDHSLFLTANGEVYASGDNNSGQLGDGTITRRLNPVKVSGLNNVVAIDAGTGFSLALTSDGSVYAWGGNYFGQLGIGSKSSKATPVKVQGLNNVVAIKAGNTHSLALTADGSVYAWGRNDKGQLGDGTTTNRTTPVKVQGLSNVVAIAAGFQYSLALTADGSVYAWGNNIFGQLGDGTTIQRLTPVKVQGLSNVVMIEAKEDHSLALMSNGEVYAWGYNSSGQLGDGTTDNAATPVKVQGLSNVVAIAAGNYHSLALTSDGSIYVWGDNYYGQLGDGTEGNYRTIPTKINGLQAKSAPAVPNVQLYPDKIVFIPGNDAQGGTSVYYRINQDNWIQYDNPVTLPDGTYDVEAKTVNQLGDESNVIRLTVNMYSQQLAKAQQAVNNAVSSKTQSAIDAAWVEVNALPENAPEKISLSQQLDQVQSEVAQQLVNEALQNPTPENIDKAKQSVEKIKDATLKNQLQNQLKTIEDQLNGSDDDNSYGQMNQEAYLALKAIERAEKYTTFSMVKYAYQKFFAVPDGDPAKEMLRNRLEQLQTKYDATSSTTQQSQAYKTAEAKVKALEIAYSPTLLHLAQDAVNVLPDGDDKDILQARIDNVVSAVQNSANSKKLKEAQDAVANAEKIKTDYYINKATELVSQLPDGQDKQSLQQRLDALKQTLSQDEINYQKALDAVKLANKYKIDYYKKKALEAINLVQDETKKQELLQMLNV